MLPRRPYTANYDPQECGRNGTDRDDPADGGAGSGLYKRFPGRHSRPDPDGCDASGADLFAGGDQSRGVLLRFPEEAIVRMEFSLTSYSHRCSLRHSWTTSAAWSSVKPRERPRSSP